MKRILSLGAGVQSSTLALMIAHGELPPIDAAVFADTQWEPLHVYKWLDWLESEINRLPFSFPVHRVKGGDLRSDIVNVSNARGKEFTSVPWHLLKEDGTRAMGKRQCTADYKIKPLHKKIRELIGLEKGQKSKTAQCQMLIGISLDEIMRMKPSQNVWAVHEFPLIDSRMSRQDCLNWMERKGYPLPPKSSCIGCPYHSDHEWRLIKADPDSWADAVMLDKLIRKQPLVKAQQFMHKSCLPLDEVDFSTAADHGQVDMFNNECEGMCGV